MNYSSWRKSLLVYLGLSFLSFILIVSSSSRVILFFKDIENTVFYPFRFIIRATGEKIGNSIDNLRNSGDLEVQLEKLKTEIESYKEKLANLNLLKEDNDRLRTTLGLKQSLEYDAISAEVIGRDFVYGYSYLTLNKGRVDGISNELPVIAFNGTDKVVVGVVEEANLMTSKIRTLKSELSSIGVYLPRTGIQSVVEGLGGVAQDIRLLYIDKSENIQKGDAVYTALDSQLFPSNLLVGTIESIDNTVKASTTYKVYVKPFAELNRVQEVFVLRPKSKG